jgi:ketosteroid isomerase-like protein
MVPHRGAPAWAAVAIALAAIWSAAVYAPASTSAQSEPATAVPPAVRVVRAFQDAWNAGRADAVLPLFATDAVVVDAQSGSAFTGRDAVYRWLEGELHSETHILSAANHSVSADPQGDRVRWDARLSTFSTRALRAPPVDATFETVVKDGKIVRHTATLDATSLTRQRTAVRDAFATRTAYVELGAPDPNTLPPIPTQPPYQPIQLPNVSQRPMPAPLPWFAIGGATLACVALAVLKRPPRL